MSAGSSACTAWFGHASARWWWAGLGGEGPCDGSGGPADVDGVDICVGWVAVPVFDIRQGWAGVHGVPVAGGSDDRELIDGAGVAPTSIFFALVAEFT